jgi:hypothetical protein
MTRSTFYSSDTALDAHEPNIGILYPDTPRVEVAWTNWSTFRIEATNSINLQVKKMQDGNLWFVLGQLGYISDTGTEDEVIDTSLMLNAKDLEDIENFWVLERIYDFRYPDFGDAVKTKALFSKYKAYQKKRVELQEELRLMFDEDVDAIVERMFDSEDTRVERA